MANDTAKTQTTNIVPVQGIFGPLPPYPCVSLIGPAGTPFYPPIDPNLDGVNITNSTINSTTVGLTTPAAAAFTSASSTSQPLGNYDLCNKLYVDAAIVGISWKQPVLTATDSSITLSGAQTISNVAVVAGDRVLVKDQATASENGIYVVGTPWVRSSDANSWNELVSAMVFVESGDLSGSAWYCSAQPGGTLGSTAVNWNNFSVAGTYFAGTGLTLSANTFSITNTGVTAGTYGSASKTLTAQVNAQGQLTSLSASDIAIAATQITSGTIDSARLSGTYSGITGLGTLTNLTVTNTISGSINGNAATATSATTATTATNLSGGASGSLPYQSAASTTAMLAKGTDGQYLTLASGLPAWTNLPSSSLTISADTANATRYPVFEQATSGSTSSLYVNTGYTFNPTTGKLSTIAWGGDYIDLNTGSTVTPAVGRLWWDGGTTLNVGMTTNVTGQVNETLFIYVKASAAISKGDVVVQDGSVGASGVLKAKPAPLATSNAVTVLGIAAESLSLNAFGLIQVRGYLRGLDTTGSSVGETWADGDLLYYNPAYVGGLTKVKPNAPNIKLPMCEVVNAASSGSGEVLVIPGSSSVLGGTDSNVQFGTLANKDLIQYNSTAGYWENVANSSVAVGTATNLAGGAAGSLPYQSGAGATTFLAAGSDGQVLKLASGVPTWSSDASGVTISDDTTTNATRYLTFTSATTGNVTTEYVASTKLSFNPSTGMLTATGLTGNSLKLNGSSSGTGTLNAPAAASTYTWTLPAATDTLAAIGFAQTWTAAQTFNSGNLKLAGSSSGTAVLNAPAAAGTNTYTLPPDACTLGYRNIPNVGTKTGSYTLAVGDVGKYVQLSTGGSITIPTSTFADGDVISLANNTTGNITITCSAPTTYIAGTDSAKTSLTLATRGIATILFLSSTVCVVSGNVS